MGRIHPQCADSDSSDNSVVADVFFGRQPDEEDDEEEEDDDDGKEEDDDDNKDEGYLESACLYLLSG